MKEIYIVNSNYGGIICAANTKEKAEKFAEIYVKYLCKNCDTEVVYHEKSWELANGARVQVERTTLYPSQGKFARCLGVTR